MDLFTNYVSISSSIHPTLILLMIPLSLAWGVPIHASWNFIICNLIACYLELILLSQGNPYNFTFAFHNFFLITTKASHFRIIQKHEAYVRGAWEIEDRFWRYFGSKNDRILQQHLARRLRARQIALRRIKYEAAAAARGDGGREIDAAQEASEVIEERAKFTRLNDRCDRAFVLTRTLAEPSVILTEAEDTAAAATKNIDLDKRCGKEILRWLAKEIQESEGFVKPVKWSKDVKTGAIICHNGYTNKNVPLDFFANSEELIVGSVSVLRPTEIAPALRLIETALDFIKFYDVNNFPGYEARRLPPSHVQFKRAVAVSCELIRYPAEFKRGLFETLDVDDPNWKDTKYIDKKAGWKLKGDYVEKDRELVSLLTVSVDRYLVVTFHIAYMLKHSTEHTCRELQRLFQDLILNKRKVKIWHNLPEKIAALDATLEHIFRGSEPAGLDERENERYNASHRKPFRETGREDILRHPHHKDTGPDDFLKVNRPSDTDFRRNVIGPNPCPLGLHAVGMDYANRNCPCDKGIIDITAIVNFILRQHKFVGLGDVKWREITSWAEPQDDFNFSDLVRWLLAGDKYQPFLSRFKSVSHIKPKKPNTEGLLPDTVEQFNNIYRMKYDIYKTEKERFSATSGETKGVENDDTCLSYVVGDAIGLGLILRNILTCEKPALLAERLIHYAYKDPVEVESCAYDTALFRKPGAPISLPSLEQLNSFTIGLEADDPHTVNDRLTPILERLSANPAWYLRQGTHSRIAGGVTFSHVIETAFLQTGWEYPRTAPRRPQEQPLPGLRAGMTTAARMRTAATAATAEAVAIEVQSIISTTALVAEVVDEAIWADLYVEIVSDTMQATESLVELLQTTSEALEIVKEVEVGREVSIATSEIIKTTLHATYELRMTLVGVAAAAERAAIPQPSGGIAVAIVEPVPTAAAIAAISRTAVELAEAAETRAAAMLVQVAATRLVLTSMIPEGLGVVAPAARAIKIFRKSAEGLKKSITRLETIKREEKVVILAEAVVRETTIPPAETGTTLTTARQAAARQAAAIKVATNVANAARRLEIAVNTEAESRTVIITADVDTVAGEKEAEVALAEAEVAGVEIEVTRGEVAVARTEAAPTQTQDSAAIIRLRQAREGVIAARANSTVAAREVAAAATRTAAAAAAEIEAIGAEAAAAAVQAAAAVAATAAVAEAAAAARQVLAVEEREAANLALVAEAEAARAVRRAVIAAEVEAENEVRILCQEFADTALSTLKEAIGTGRHSMITEILLTTTLMVEAAATSAVAIVKSLARTTAMVATRAGNAEVASSKATRTRAAEAAIIPRLALFGPDDLIPDGNYGMALTVRNLATKILRNNRGYMPTGFAEILRPARDLNNGVWFRAFVNLLEWHCELESLLLPEEELMVICNNVHPTPEELRFQADFRAKLVARVVITVPPAGNRDPALNPNSPYARRAVEKVDLHNFVDEVCAEILIFMLVQEISKLEGLDAARRLVLGIDKAIVEYGISAGFSMWDSVTIKHVKETFNLDSFIYQNPHWFKRLQVLLGYEFTENIPMRSSSSSIFSQCGAKNLAELVEMLIQEIERFLKIYKYQDQVKEHFARTVLGAQRGEKRSLLWSIKAKANRIAKGYRYPLDRREPLHKLDKYNTFRRPDLARPWIVTPGVITEADALRNAREKLDNWRLPEWCTALLLRRKEPDCSGPAVERLFSPLPTTYLRPNSTRVRKAWLEAVIILLKFNNKTGPESWDGIRKWWTSGLWIQGLGLADEHVDQALLPDLKLITEDAPVPNPIPLAVVQDQRTHNAVNRAWIHRALSADREIEALAAESRAV